MRIRRLADRKSGSNARAEVAAGDVRPREGRDRARTLGAKVQATTPALGIGFSNAFSDRDGKGRCAGQRGEGCRQRDQLAMSNWSTSYCYRPAHALACRLVHARSSSAMARRLISKGSSGDLVCCQHSTLTGPRCARSFPMNAARKRGRQMASIKGVMLLALDAKSYCRHMAHHAFQSKVNSGTKTPDYRHELTQLVEERAFGRKCSCIFLQPGFGSCVGSK